MPNTKSAERRVRNSARKEAHNLGIKSRIKTLERNYVAAVQQGNKDAAGLVLRSVISALDKAAKSGVIHKATASRKKSRLTLRMRALK